MTVLPPPAPHGRRALAWLVDLAWVGLVALLFTTLVDTRWLVPFAALYLIAYSTTCTWLTGRTAGKAMFGLRLRRAERRPGFFWALGRASFGYAVIDVFGAGVLLALGNERHRCLHDLVFGSEVVLERAEPIRPGALWSGLLGFEAERRAASEERTKSLGVLKGLVRFVLKLTFPLAWLLEHRKEHTALAAPAPAPIASVGTLSAKARVAVVAVTTAITSAVVVSASGWDGPRRVSFPRPGPDSSSRTTGPDQPPVSITQPDPGPGLVATPTALDFGDQAVGTSSPEHSVELTNRGAREVTVGEVKVTGADPDEFSVTLGLCRGAPVGPGGTCRLSLRFTPFRVGGSSAILAIRSGSTGNTLTVALTGSGTRASFH
jgi:uncharacterized RDD family membrane protein YckC